MNIVVIGTGYVGLVTGVALAEIGHDVCCVDIDAFKVAQLKKSISPIYEPGIEELIEKNINAGRLTFSTDLKAAVTDSSIVYLAVGTPQKQDGSANLEYIEEAAMNIAQSISQDTVVVVKSTVPVGTNRYLKKFIQNKTPYKISIVSNPEFLREGVAVKDVFHGDRIVLGADDDIALEQLEAVNQGFQIPIFKTGLESAEMIKYASNAFLATKISFINEIANICEKVGGDIREVSAGMGMDHRIGSSFLQAGIGYGGSCFPKDTLALNQIAKNSGYDFKLIQSVIQANKAQQLKLVKVLKSHYNSDLKGKQIALLGVAFKPETDDIREAASEVIIKELLWCGAKISIYDPVAAANMKAVFGEEIHVAETIEEVLYQADAALVVTEWDEIKKIKLEEFSSQMKHPLVLDGRLVFDKDQMKKAGISYYSIGTGELQLNEPVYI
ncbi:UDP-glucose/GDP-mannose dehydrogenase family protein [Listeria weihenstephanensis]|uniref:UDP-glucose 6-dehydrogenase n=1 Tax=Listeria weihenstephanensis TaxID=1006155 RepID=A0A1S7FZ13_9LIST|nr:UDP-glucose/GDP-mannose dehydrogenase family protein [Listeria weihenstephanensis]AQY52587.1 UDP-glucose 6-dehydrogenase [Listeria weihenstephanensis]MBC1501696.1 UDP-glucose/GDP-mannose dehydrogenase family protein [Listeria weihenstephanensis]